VKETMTASIQYCEPVAFSRVAIEDQRAVVG
jgi:hypothetical protein